MTRVTAATTTHTLDNGLTVLARPVRQAPVVAFFIWYRVGSRNERPGLTGVSHWVEHMMFKGTPRYGKGQLDRLVTSRGGQWNAFTWLDFTAYFEVLPKEHLDLALEIESDRMVNALFDPEEVEAERTVIISERQGLENHPGFWLGEAVMAAAYQAHPYRQSVIGFLSDLRAITRDDLYNHYRRHYSPNNAVIVAVGDFETSDLLERVEREFGSIPAGEPVPPVRVVEPAQMGERRVTIRRPGPTSYLNMVYHAPAGAHADCIPLMVADAVLSGGKGFAGRGGGMGRSSRFYRRLVDTGLATGAVSRMTLTRDPGVFEVDVTLRPDADRARVEETVLAEIEDLRCSGPADDELARAVKQVRARLAYGLDGVMNQAMLLGQLAMIGREDELERLSDLFETVTTAGVRRVAEDYLDPDRRTVGWFIPTGDHAHADAEAGPAGVEAAGNDAAEGREVGDR